MGGLTSEQAKERDERLGRDSEFYRQMGAKAKNNRFGDWPKKKRRAAQAKGGAAGRGKSKIR